MNRRGILEAPPGTHPVGRLEAHRWVYLAMQHPLNQSGNAWLYVGLSWSPSHPDGTVNHLRFGEIASGNNMNYVADATFANVRVARTAPHPISMSPYRDTPGRYYKEGGNYVGDAGATYTSPPFPAGLHPRRVTWTEIPCDLWFDENGDGWLGDPPLLANVQTGNPAPIYTVVWVPTEVRANPSAEVNFQPYAPKNDRFGAGGSQGRNGLRDVHIELEIWDDLGTDTKSDDVMLARFDNPAAANRIPRPMGRVYYKAVFVNEWDPATRANYPLDVTPFLDDVTITAMEAGGPRVVSWEPDPPDE